MGATRAGASSSASSNCDGIAPPSGPRWPSFLAPAALMYASLKAARSSGGRALVFCASLALAFGSAARAPVGRSRICPTLDFTI